MTRAILVDALGTLVELELPWTHLARSLDAEPGERLERAVRAEMAYYREHSHEGRDAASLADLRARCARVLSHELGRGVSVETMMDAIRFRAYDDAAPALAELGERGLRRICVSNWDHALPAVLADCGLSEVLDGVVTSAEADSRKPDPEIFRRALQLAGCSADEAVHVGDTRAEDVAGAGAAGIAALLIDRGGGGDIASLAELADRL